jgi:flagellar biosynthesis protein FlhG
VVPLRVVGADEAPVEAIRGRARVMAFTGGKGGVGKTSVAVNSAMALARAGYRTLLLDADLGLANVDVMLGLAPRFNLGHILRGERELRDVLLEGPEGVGVLPGSSGTQELTRLSDRERWRLLGELEKLDDRYDAVLVDTPAGISDNVVYFASAVQDVVVIVTSEPTSLTDAYATVKVLGRKAGVRRFELLVNEVPTEDEAREIHRRLTVVTDRFLDVELAFAGHIPPDQNLVRGIMEQVPVVLGMPRSPAAQAIARFARGRMEAPPSNGLPGGLGIFWRRILREQGAPEPGAREPGGREPGTPAARDPGAGGGGRQDAPRAGDV